MDVKKYLLWVFVYTPVLLGLLAAASKASWHLDHKYLVEEGNKCVQSDLKQIKFMLIEQRFISMKLHPPERWDEIEEQMKPIKELYGGE